MGAELEERPLNSPESATKRRSCAGGERAVTGPGGRSLRGKAGGGAGEGGAQWDGVAGAKGPCRASPKSIGSRSKARGGRAGAPAGKWRRPGSGGALGRRVPCPLPDLARMGGGGKRCPKTVQAGRGCGALLKGGDTDFVPPDQRLTLLFLSQGPPLAAWPLSPKAE